MNELQLIPEIVLLRTPLQPTRVGQGLLHCEDAFVELRRIFAAPTLRFALQATSPALFSAVGDWLATGEPCSEKAQLRLLAFAMRLCLRCTPLGVAGRVSRLRVGEFDIEPILDSADDTMTFSRPDSSVWLNIASSIESQSELRMTLRVFVNNARYIKGGFLHIYQVQHERTRSNEQSAESISRIRLTPFVHAAIEYARNGVLWRDLVDQVAARVQMTSEQCTRLLDRLWEAGLFISELRCQPTADAEEHLLSRLPAELEELRRSLIRARELRQRFDGYRLGEKPPDDFERLRSAYAGFTGVANALQLDSHVKVNGEVPRAIFEEAATLAALQLRSGSRLHFKEYGRRFEERYDSPNALVPLLELCDAESGLGRPEDPVPRAGSDLAPVSTLRFREAAEALALGRDEITLTAESVDRWFPPLPVSTLPEAVELKFSVNAESFEAVRRGDYTISVPPYGATVGLGRSLGRFASVFPELADHLRESWRKIVDDDKTRAELVYVPPVANEMNLCTRSQVMDRHISIGLSQHNAIPLEDLFVGRDGLGFFVFSSTLGRRVDVHECHMLQNPTAPPSVVKFLIGLAKERQSATWFDWGSALELPALPRLRYGKCIIAPRQWHMPVELLRGGSSDDRFDRVSAWRATWGVPEIVNLVREDATLRLNLARRTFVDLLSDQVRESQAQLDRAILQEVLPGAGDGWLTSSDGEVYASEFVASYACPKREKTIRDSSPTGVEQGRSFPPGSRYLYSKLYCGASQLDALMRSICDSELALAAEGTFVVRYADDRGTHLRWRLKLGERADADDAINALVKYLSRLHHDEKIRAFSLDTFEPEIQRYGGWNVYHHVERIFTHSTMAAADLFSSPVASVSSRLGAAIRSFEPVLLGLFELDGAMTYLKEGGRSRLPMTPMMRSLVRELAPGSGTVPACEHARAIGEIQRTQLLTVTISELANSLFHMHCNRFGIDPHIEPLAQRIQYALFAEKKARAGAALTP